MPLDGMPPQPAAARMLPDVAMNAADGRAVRPGDYRHRKHLVVVVLPDAPAPYDPPILRALARRHVEFSEENAEILAVLPPSAPWPPRPAVADDCPFPVVQDRDGALSCTLSGRRAPSTGTIAVHVADRYGEIFRTLAVTGANPFPLEEVLAWVRFLERLCPE